MGRAHVRKLDLVALVVLVLALAAGTGLRLHAQHENPNVQHDEAWSYASAAGRLHELTAAMDGGLTGRWVPAGQWQRLWRSDGLTGLTQIAPGLAAYDVHPPLYFGLLHGWLVLVRDDLWGGRALNLVLAALTVLGIYGMARAMGFEPIEGALAALVWAVSPAVVGISSIARQYDLVALSTVLLVWGLVRATAPARVRDGSPSERVRRVLNLVWLAVATVAALLTHYQAALLVAGAAVYVLVARRPPGEGGRRPSRWPPLVALGVGAAAAAVASDWTRALDNEGTMLVAPSFTGLVGKLGRHRRHGRPGGRGAGHAGRNRGAGARRGAGAPAFAPGADRAPARGSARLAGAYLLPGPDRAEGSCCRTSCSSACPSGSAPGTWLWPGRSPPSCRSRSSGCGRGCGCR